MRIREKTDYDSSTYIIYGDITITRCVMSRIVNLEFSSILYNAYSVMSIIITIHSFRRILNENR